MKKVISLMLVVLFLGVTVTGAEETGGGESNAIKVERSMKKWAELRGKCKGNYSYKKAFSSWAGFGNETTIVVRNNKVAERHYREWSRAAAAQPVPVEPGHPPESAKPLETTWRESGDQVGSHAAGAKPLTLDDLYREAKAIAEKTLSPHETLYVQFDGQGLLNSCFYVDTRIMGDAPATGVTIREIKLDIPEHKPNPSDAAPGK